MAGKIAKEAQHRGEGSTYGSEDCKIQVWKVFFPAIGETFDRYLEPFISLLRAGLFGGEVLYVRAFLPTRPPRTFSVTQNNPYPATRASIRFVPPAVPSKTTRACHEKVHPAASIGRKAHLNYAPPRTTENCTSTGSSRRLVVLRVEKSGALQIVVVSRGTHVQDCCSRYAYITQKGSVDCGSLYRPLLGAHLF